MTNWGAFGLHVGSRALIVEDTRPKFLSGVDKRLRRTLYAGPSAPGGCWVPTASNLRKFIHASHSRSSRNDSASMGNSSNAEVDSAISLDDVQTRAKKLQQQPGFWLWPSSHAPVLPGEVLAVPRFARRAHISWLAATLRCDHELKQALIRNYGGSGGAMGSTNPTSTPAQAADDDDVESARQMLREASFGDGAETFNAEPLDTK